MRYNTMEAHVAKTLNKLAEENDKALAELKKECIFKVGNFEIRPIINTYGKELRGYEVYYKGVKLKTNRFDVINTQQEAENLIAEQYSDNIRINESFKQRIEEYRNEVKELEEKFEEDKKDLFSQLSYDLRISDVQGLIIKPKFNEYTLAIEGYTFSKESGKEEHAGYYSPIETIKDFKEFADFVSWIFFEVSE